VRLSVCDHWTQRKVTGKNKTTVGWRAFEVLKPWSWEPKTEGLKPRSWYPGPETSRRGPETSRWGPETQVLRSRSWNLALRARNPGPDIQVLKPRVEGLKPRSWDPGPETSRWGLESRSWERACVINWLKQLTGYPLVLLKRGDRGWKQAQKTGWRQGDFTDNFDKVSQATEVSSNFSTRL